MEVTRGNCGAKLDQAHLKQTYNEAIQEFNALLNLPGARALGLMGLAYTNGLAGNRKEAEKDLGELLELRKGQYTSPAQLAVIYIALGEKDKAFEYLEEANRGYDLNVMRLKVERRFDPLRSDPPFADLVRRIGIP